MQSNAMLEINFRINAAGVEAKIKKQYRSNINICLFLNKLRLIKCMHVLRIKEYAALCEEGISNGSVQISKYIEYETDMMLFTQTAYTGRRR
jgi:hypothetical protein